MRTQPSDRTWKRARSPLITPPVTDPEWIPTRSDKFPVSGPNLISNSFVRTCILFRINLANLIMTAAWFFIGSGTPWNSNLSRVRTIAVETPCARLWYTYCHSDVTISNCLNLGKTEESSGYMSTCFQMNIQTRHNFELAHFEYFASLGNPVERLIHGFK